MNKNRVYHAKTSPLRISKCNVFCFWYHCLINLAKTHNNMICDMQTIFFSCPRNNYIFMRHQLFKFTSSLLQLETWVGWKKYHFLPTIHFTNQSYYFAITFDCEFRSITGRQDIWQNFDLFKACFSHYSAVCGVDWLFAIIVNFIASSA